MSAASVKAVVHQPAWTLRSDEVELAVTQLGGHMAPVTFYRNSASPVQPYYVSPWQGEKQKIDEPVLVPLRGDFFCLPFGGNGMYRGTMHRVHGEPAGAKWRFEAQESAGRASTLILGMQTTALPGKVTKRLTLVDGQNVVYVQHVLEGYRARTSLGHHATLAVPDKERSLEVATSPIQFGMTNPTVPDPTTGEYSSLPPGERFTSLSRVPTIWKAPATDDAAQHPARTGFTDLLAVFNKPSRTPGWTTATVDSEGYLWFSLKDVGVLPTTLLWVSNRGRHMAPWNGRNRCLGLEDVCGYFAEGIAASAKKNPLNEQGIPTSIQLSPKTPLAVNYIQGVVKVPRGFRKVRSAAFGKGEVTFTSVTGKKVTAEVQHEFLNTGTV